MNMAVALAWARQHWEPLLWCLGALAMTLVALRFGQWLVAVASLGFVCWLLWPWLLTKAAPVRRWFGAMKAELIARFDKAPAFWVGAAANEEHEGYRQDYELLATKPARSRSELFLLAEIVDGLQHYGDNPLAAPPTLRARAFAGVGAAAGNGTLLKVAAVACLLLVAGCVALWGRGEALKAARDAPCNVMEIAGVTSRQACRDLAATQLQVRTLSADLRFERASRAQAIETAVAEAQATVALNQRRADRERASAARRERARIDDQESARNARAPDWGSRLRDLADPVAGPDAAGTGAGPNPASGVPGASAGTDGLRPAQSTP